ncbi:hypothetical protein HDU96_003758 [Phlyctochytrium bullatum]|nr:hypothetical protein HDU96_003758 [Phlyctochytrium bullatum]
MDAGYDPPGKVAKVMPKTSELKTLKLSAERVIGFLDKLFELEMTCMRGNPLTQTIFTTPLTHIPHDIDSKLLRQIIVGTLKGIDVWRQLVLLRRVYEDEEFTFDPAIFSILMEVSESEAIAGLLEVEESLLVIWRTLKEPLEKVELPPGRELEALEALLARLRLRRAYLQAMAFIYKRNLPSAKKSVSQALTQAKICHESTDFIGDVSDLFDPELNKKLFLEGPPRHVQYLTRDETFSDLINMLSEISICLNVNSSLSIFPLLVWRTL